MSDTPEEERETENKGNEWYTCKKRRRFHRPPGAQGTMILHCFPAVSLLRHLENSLLEFRRGAQYLTNLSLNPSSAVLSMWLWTVYWGWGCSSIKQFQLNESVVEMRNFVQ